MLSNSSKTEILKSELSKFLKNNKENLLDIILFGSLVKGKDKPEDVDILLLFKEKKDSDMSYSLKKILNKLNFKADISDLLYSDLFLESFVVREAFLSEGFSISAKKYVFEGLNYESFMLIKYDLKDLNKSSKMMFYYGLNGRKKNQKGLLAKLGAHKLSDNTILCPIVASESIKEFFDYWKIGCLMFPVLIPKRLNHLLKA